MKKIIYLLLLATTILNAQDDSFKRLSLSANLNTSIAIGDNFLNKGYSNKNGFDVEAQFYIISHVFIGFHSRTVDLTLKNADLIGNFNNAKVVTDLYFIGYKHNVAPKMYMEHRFGSGSRMITNYSNLSEYAVTGKSYLVGSRFDYYIQPELAVYAGLDFAITNYDVQLSGPYKDFYNKSYDLSPMLGIRFSFWTAENKSKNNEKQ